ncbi:MAG: PLP-dependent aminotransferase family protein [Schleiferiaceae bacterium]|nr:PLP-dependent aminotransferase family protein [Schleiferiaceae bacterium]
MKTDILDLIQQQWNIKPDTIGVKRNPSYIRLFEIFKHLIQSGVLTGQTTLPPSRKLSESLGLSRSTVIRAYELLSNQGFTNSRKGSGYFVSNRIYPLAKTPQLHSIELSTSGISFLKSFKKTNPMKSGAYAFQPGIPPLDLFPVNKWKSLLNKYWRNVQNSGLTYSSSFGLEQFREALSMHLSINRGIQCSPEQIIVVSGSVQSLFITGSILINPGDPVAIQIPSFPNVLAIFSGLQAEISSLDTVISQKKPVKLIHVTATTRYPDETILTRDRKELLLNSPNLKKSIIIENDFEHDLTKEYDDSQSLFSLDKEGRVIYLSTFNRILHPSIRLAFMIVPKSLIEPVRAFTSQSHRSVPSSIQVVMDEFIRNGLLRNHIHEVRKHHGKRWDVFSKSWTSLLPELPLPPFPKTMNTIAYYHGSIKDWDLTASRLLAENGINTHALSKCYMYEDSAKQGLIMSFTCLHHSQIPLKISQIAKLLRNSELI